jgi:exosortase/archaeosortase family protein
MQKITNPGLLFIGKFLSLFALFYFFTYYYIGVVAPGGYYSPFLHDYANYVDWLRSSILHGANTVCHLFDLNTNVKAPFLLRVENGPGVRMVYTCIGYGVMSFWAAFVIANDGSLKKKLLWLLGGLWGIWLINCFRVALLLITLEKQGDINKFAEHHTMFNTIAYSFIFAIIYLFARKRKKRGGA